MKISNIHVFSKLKKTYIVVVSSTIVLLRFFIVLLNHFYFHIQSKHISTHVYEQAEIFFYEENKAFLLKGNCRTKNISSLVSSLQKTYLVTTKPHPTTSSSLKQKTNDYLWELYFKPPSEPRVARSPLLNCLITS